MSSMINAITAFLSYSVLAIGAQNVIFSRGLGLSNGLRMINDPRKDLLYFCASLTGFQLLNSVLAYFAVPLISKTPLADYVRFASPVIIVLCCAVSYIIVVFILGLVLDRNTFKGLIYSLTGASINSAIVGTIILSLGRGFNLPETLGFAFGSSVGYLFAMLLVCESERKICYEMVPKNFQGLPIKLIYISVLALAVYGLTGHLMPL